MNQDLIGRLHPLLVHLPIGFLILAFLFELLALSKRFKKLRQAVPAAVLIGFFAALLSLTTGLFLEEEGGYDDRILFRHKLFAFITCGFSLTLILLISYQKNLEKGKRKVARLLLFCMLMVALTVTGHFGGSLTHGADYLSSETQEIAQPTPVVKNPEVVYEDIIRPVLEKKCYSCHSSKKQKGQLRLDGKDFILKGGKHGTILSATNSSGSLLERITRPIDNEDHMPPVEKEQLTSLETELISEWVRTGASFDTKAAEFNEQLLKKYLESVSSVETNNWWPKDEIDPAPESAINLLTQKGVRVSKISSASNYLEVIFNSSVLADAQTWETLDLISSNIASARFSFTAFSDADLSRIKNAGQLRRLFLDHTHITDKALPEIMKFVNLNYLNLVHTEISDSGLKSISNHRSLRELYIYDTRIKQASVREFLKSNPDIRVDTGMYNLTRRPTDTIIFKPILP
jgi:uncharacterized membrane protein/mono/diheme cytochrome c family protein